MVGIVSFVRVIVIKVEGDIIQVFVIEGIFVLGELVIVGVIGFFVNIVIEIVVVNSGFFVFNEIIINFFGDIVIVEEINFEFG